MTKRRKSSGWLNIVVVPNDQGQVFSFRLPLVLLQVLGLVVVVLLVSGLLIANNYRVMGNKARELDELRLVIREQRQYLEELTSETEQLQQEMHTVRELDRQLRELLDLSGSSLPPVDDARIASFDDEDVFDGVGGVAEGVRLGGIDIAASTTAELDMLINEVSGRRESLEILRALLAERIAEEAARPSIWPTNGYITSNFGYRRSPTGGGGEHHPGIDIAAPTGTPVVSTADGIVTFAGRDGGYGKEIRVNHGNGLETLYGHLSKIAVMPGDRVGKGQIIGYVGNTGRSTGPHLHYEVHIGGQKVNPRNYLGPKP